MGDNVYNHVLRYTDQKAYSLYVGGAKQEGTVPHDMYGSGRRNNRSSEFAYPSRLSVYDGLFGAVPAYFVGWQDIGFDAIFPAQYSRLATRVVTSMYLGMDRWKDANHILPILDNWVDVGLASKSRRWITSQMRGYRGISGKHKGYELPEPVPLSQVLFEEYGISPKRSARDFIYSSEEVEEILSNGWYPREIFRNVLSVGGVEGHFRGVKVLVAEEDFVPKNPISFLPFDRYVADSIYRLYSFVEKVWEDSSVLDDITGFVVYRRNDLHRDRRSLPVILPDFGVSWGWLLYSMVWQVMSRFDDGLYALGAQGTRLAGTVESSLGTYHVFPAVSPFKVHGSTFSWGVDEFLNRENTFFERYDVPLKYEEPYAEIGLRSAWRYYQQSPAELLTMGNKQALVPVFNLKRWFVAMGYTWVFGFGYIVEEDGKYFYYFGDPYTSFGPTPYEDYFYEVFGQDRFWFNYRSVPFFEFMRKFVFMYLEMLRRFGENIIPGRYVQNGKVNLDELFGTVSAPFRDIPEDVLNYTGREDFLKLPFHVVFNMAMSVFPVIMYSDVLPFRTYYHYTYLYLWGNLHRVPGMVWKKEGEDAPPEVVFYDAVRHYTRVDWFPKMTYAGTTKAYIGKKYRGFSGDVSALVESSAYTAVNSMYMPGQLMYRLPYYDLATFELLVSFLHNLRASVDWSAVDATGGGKNLAFFDDSTTYFIPYSWMPFYGKKSEGITPLGLLVKGYGEHLFVWVARAYSRVVNNESMRQELIKVLLGVYGKDVLPRVREYLWGQARNAYDRDVSELVGVYFCNQSNSTNMEG